MSPAAPAGSFVRCVCGICCRRRLHHNFASDVRMDLLCCLRLVPDPSSNVPVGCAVSSAAPSGSFVRCVGWTCCVAWGFFRIRRPICRWDLLCRRRLLQDLSSYVSVGVAVSSAGPSGFFVRCVVVNRCVAGGFFRVNHQRWRWELLCCRRSFPDLQSDVQV